MRFTIRTPADFPDWMVAEVNAIVMEECTRIGHCVPIAWIVDGRHKSRKVCEARRRIVKRILERYVQDSTQHRIKQKFGIRHETDLTHWRTISLPNVGMLVGLDHSALVQSRSKGEAST